jgi:peptidyl-prolyl cis-trans isomerase SurA
MMTRLLAALLLLGLVFSASPGLAQPGASAPAAGGNRILAVVNGDVVTEAELAARARLFALNAGVPLSPEALARLQPQVLRQLIDERLRLQEIQRRRIAVSDNDILEALNDIERRNNLRPGALVAQLRQAGVAPRVLYDQIRAQLGWGRLMRGMLGPQAEVSEQDVQDAIAARRARQGQPEFLLGEIFIPVDDPANEADARRFTEDVIGQLRRGVPFAVVATQFSQAQSAVQGGDVGWLPADRLDPEVAAVAQRMPVGAISSPIRVPGGFQIVVLRARRDGGTASAVSTIVTVRQLFLPFTSTLDPAAPTDQQRATLERAQRLQSTLRGCEQMDALPRSSDRPLDPGPLRLEGLSPPPLRQLVASLPLGRTSQPLVASDGITLIMVCSREQRQIEDFTPEVARALILRDRVEVLSRQLQRELRRRAVIEMRG